MLSLEWREPLICPCECEQNLASREWVMKAKKPKILLPIGRTAGLAFQSN